MNARSTSSASSPFSGVKQTVSTFWGERNPRERGMLTVAIVVIVFGLFYSLLIDPALGGRKDLEKTLPALRQQSAEMQSLSKEAVALGSKAGVSVPAISKESLEKSLAGKGLKPQNVALAGEGLAKVQLNAVSFAGMIDWLSELQKSARVTVVDANVLAQDKPDTVNATLTLRQQRNEQAQ